VQQATQSALSALWTEAQELANEALHVAQTAWDAERAEVEKLRVELSSAIETQGAELEALRLKLAEVEKEASTAAAASERSRMETAQQVVALTDQAHTASARAQEIEKRAEDLKTALMAAQPSEQRLRAGIEAERRQHGATREQSNAVSTELMTAKARAEAQAVVQLEQVERLKRVEADLAAARVPAPLLLLLAALAALLALAAPAAPALLAPVALAALVLEDRELFRWIRKYQPQPALPP
jgi:tRNA A37 N6-isopentenylltransferase MiaA